MKCSPNTNTPKIKLIVGAIYCKTYHIKWNKLGSFCKIKSGRAVTIPAPINSNVDNIEIDPNEPKPWAPVITR